VSDKNAKNPLDDEGTLAAVMKEMAKPRLTVSVRNIIEKAHTKTRAKFSVGALLYNRNAKENGLVKRVYQLSGVVMYEVSVPATANTYYTSDWAESALELSNYATLKTLKSSDEPRRD
jgi:hypothetical protein